MTFPGRRRLLARTAGLLALAAVLVAAPPAPADPPNPAFLEGTHVFRRILFDRHFTALGSFGELGEDPAHSILIVLGDATRLKDVPGGLRHFVEDGGAVLLATDEAITDGDARNAVIQTAGVEVAGEKVVCQEQEACFRGLNVCPYLAPLPKGADTLFPNLQGDNRAGTIVATNAPSFLVRNQPNGAAAGLDAMASLPAGCRPESMPPGMPFGNMPFGDKDHPLFAVGGVLGGGRLLVMADHSIFINEMMLPEDDGNVEFAINCLEWLRGGDDPGRTKVLFLEEGSINTRFDVPLKNELPAELIDRIAKYADTGLAIANHQLASLDKRGVLSQKLRQWLKDHGFTADVLLSTALVILAYLILKYLSYRIGWAARYRRDMQGPLLSTALHRLAPSASLPEQRRQAVVQGNNLWEAARDLARQCLAAAGVPPAATALPAVTVRGGWRRRATMAGRVRRLWRLAHGPAARVSLLEWQRLLREVEELKAALADGSVRLNATP